MRRLNETKLVTSQNAATAHTRNAPPNKVRVREGTLQNEQLTQTKLL